MQKGFTVWLTGLPCSGKTTISKFLAQELKKRGIKVEILDGDVIRTNLSKGLTFSKKDRDINIHRVGFVANLLTRNGIAVMCAVISPYKKLRDENRKLIGNFIEVYVKASVEECARRDVDGLYKKAYSGVIKEFTGVSAPYEEPENPEVVCDTENDSVSECAQKIIRKLQELGYLEKDSLKTEVYTETEKKIIENRLKNLGYL